MLGPLANMLGPLGQASSLPWTPASIAGLRLWLKADAGTLDGSGSPSTNGGVVATWKDQSGSNDATQGTNGQRPTLATSIKNGKPALLFSGGQMLATPSITVGAFTLFMVHKLTASGIIIEQSVSANANDGFYVAGTNDSSNSVRRTSRSRRTIGVNWAVGTWYASTLRYAGTNATNQMWLNGALQTETTDESNDPGTGNASAALYIGARSGLVAPITGYLAEVILYNSALSTGDRGAVESYLIAKYATP